MSTSSIDRRRFQRLELTDETRAIDDAGRDLGRVAQASGGGMSILCETQAVADSINVGQKLTVTVMEPSSQTQNTVHVIVRSKDKLHIGLEFAGGKK